MTERRTRQKGDTHRAGGGHRKTGKHRKGGKLSALQLQLVDLVRNVRPWSFDKAKKFCVEHDWRKQEITQAIREDLECKEKRLPARNMATTHI